jgi:D-alanyl-D-alanine carboxypeptidase/D-alanyl-D-alanine-endopeptidase (penicillin-binding protein 4)
VSGTLSSVCKNEAAHGKMKAKSGTMSRVKSYAGYIESSSGKTIAFSIIVNNYNCSNSATVQEMEKIFNALSSF